MSFKSIPRTVGDTLNPLVATLLDQVKDPVNLTSSTVTFRMWSEDGSIKVADGACTILDATAGQVSYDFQAADVDTVGIYYAWFVQTRGGEEQHYPEDGEQFQIEIKDAP